MAEPRFLSWGPRATMRSHGKKNVMAIGMSGGFVDPMEANVIYVAQAWYANAQSSAKQIIKVK